MKWTDRKNKGQSLLEFTLVALLLLLLLVGMAEFSRAWWTVSILTDAAREAVRIYARDPAFGGGVGPAISIADSILGSNDIIGATYGLVDDWITLRDGHLDGEVQFPVGGRRVHPGSGRISTEKHHLDAEGIPMRTPPLQERPIG